MARSFFSRKGHRSGTGRDGATVAPAAAGTGPDDLVTEPKGTSVTSTEVPEGAPDSGEDAGPESAVSQPVDLDGAALRWKSQLAEAAKEETQALRSSSVSLSSAHPGGLASLYAGIPTKLSTVIRESGSLAAARNDLESLQLFVEELRQKHGAADLYLSIGLASWGGDQPAEAVPALMRKVTVEKTGSGLELCLQPGVELSSRLLREAARNGAEVDHQVLVEALGSSEGMAPTAALEALRELGKVIPGFQLAEHLSVSMVRHPASRIYRDLSDRELLSDSPLVGAIAGVSDDAEWSRVEVDYDLTDRDPWQEVGVGDQSPASQSVIELLADGGSHLAHSQSNSDLVAAAVSTAATLAQEGKRVLLVSSDRAFRAAISARLEDTDMAPVVADFFAGEGVVASRLEEAMKDASPWAEMSRVDTMRAALKRVRASLQSYETTLHEEFADWEVTPFDALQVLTELTSDPDGPTTRVRLSETTLSALAEDGGEGARELLEEASEQGFFTGEAALTPWSQVRLSDSAEAETVLGAATELARDQLPALRVQMARVAGQTGLRSATTLAGWAAQLGLIEEAQGLLDEFRPEVFDRSPADLIVATATPEWRKQQSISLKRSKRRVLVRQARDLVRPGVHVPDLHSALLRVQDCRQRWMAASTQGEPWPVVPEGLSQCRQTQQEVEASLAAVAPYLEEVFGDLQTMPLDELSAAMEALAADPDGARLQPGRLRIVKQLDALGLQELVEDFQVRRVDGELIGLELDLSWWASALGVMLSAEPQLGGFDPEILQSQLSDLRELDSAQVASLGPAIVQRIKERQREALALYPEQYTALVAGLADQEPVAPMFGEYALAWDMLPIVLAGPALVPELVSKRHKVDVVIAIGTSGVAEGEMVPVVAKAESLVAFASGTPGDWGWMNSLRGAVPAVQLPAQVRPATGPVARVVVETLDQTSLLFAPSPRPDASLELLKVDGSGMPAPGAVAVESSVGESEAVAAYVRDCALEEPDVSLAVVAFSDIHADRLRSTLRRLEVGDALFGAWAANHGGSSALVVTPGELAEVGPEHTVISVGFAKTPHGRVIHDFGVLSGPDGDAVVEALAQGASSRVTLATTLESSEIDPERVKQPGARVLLALLRAAEGEDRGGAQQGRAEVPDDLLVDLADRLHTKGLEVVPNLGSGSMRIPLAVGHPEVPGRLLVAVLTDDSEYLREPSLRLRDRWKHEQLEALGWKVRTELSMSVFIDPNHEVDQIVNLVLDAVDQHYVDTGMPMTPASAQMLAEADEPEGGNAETNDSAGFLVEDDYDAVYVSTETGMIEAVRSDHESPTEGQDEEVETVDAVLPGEEAPQPEGLAEPAGYTDSPKHEPSEAILSGDARAVGGAAPSVVKGLPLAAYSDDQLDEVGAWLWSEHPDASRDEMVDLLREFLGLRRRGSQSQAVLAHVVERTSGGAAEPEA